MDSVKVGLEWMPWWRALRAQLEPAVDAGESASDDDTDEDTEEEEDEGEEDGPGSEPAAPTLAEDDGDAGNEAKEDRVAAVDWKGEPDVGVWEMLTSRAELLQPAVDLNAVLDPKLYQQLKVEGVSSRKVSAESKRRKAKAAKEKKWIKAHNKMQARAEAEAAARAAAYREEREYRERARLVAAEEQAQETSQLACRLSTPELETSPRAVTPSSPRGIEQGVDLDEFPFSADGQDATASAGREVRNAGQNAQTRPQAERYVNVSVYRLDDGTSATKALQDGRSRSSLWPRARAQQQQQQPHWQASVGPRQGTPEASQSRARAGGTWRGERSHVGRRVSPGTPPRTPPGQSALVRPMVRGVRQASPPDDRRSRLLARLGELDQVSAATAPSAERLAAANRKFTLAASSSPGTAKLFARARNGANGPQGRSWPRPGRLRV